jgi:NADH-quinone oxidoreductase subunit F
MLKNDDKVFNNLNKLLDISFNDAKNLGSFVNTFSILEKGSEFILNEVIESGLKGRGGAGFSTGTKWSFIKRNDPRPKYLVINGDEGEPGTCKDREIFKYESYKLLEGILLASYTINANVCYIYIRGEFYQESVILQHAINECYKNGFFGKNIFKDYSLDVYIHLGAGAYICGEESALIESLEGKKGQPRLKPPFPANIGLYGCPTLVNNVETIATIPTILQKGSKWYSSLGVKNSIGTKLFCISGHINKPCIIEEELGVTFSDLINHHCNGIIGDWDNLQAIIPGGSSTPLLIKEVCMNLKMDNDSLKSAGSALGTGAIMVFDKTVDMVAIIAKLSHFYMHESCGQCTPCREGTGWIYRIISKMVTGQSSLKELDTLKSIINNIEGKTICGLGDAATWVIKGLLKNYDYDIKERILKYQSNSNNAKIDNITLESGM